MTRYVTFLSMVTALSVGACNKSDSNAVTAGAPIATTAAPSDPNSMCNKLAKNLSPLMAMSYEMKVKGATQAELKAIPQKAQPILAAKCEASTEKNSDGVKCLAAAKTLGEIEGCQKKDGYKAVDAWGDAVIAELKTAGR